MLASPERGVAERGMDGPVPFPLGFIGAVLVVCGLVWVVEGFFAIRGIVEPAWIGLGLISTGLGIGLLIATRRHWRTRHGSLQRSQWGPRERGRWRAREREKTLNAR